MKIMVIGAGYVGLVAACCLANDGHQVTCVEKNPEKLNMLRKGISPIFEKDMDAALVWALTTGNLSFIPLFPNPIEAEVVMVAVGTPSLPSGATDLSDVYDISAELQEAATGPLTVVMKSTVPPGTGMKLTKYFQGTPITYVSNPEFLREGQAIEDWHHPSRIVIGTNDSQAVALVQKLYAGIDAPVIVADITSSELIKYASNAFLVTKISFINEIANCCEVVDADIEDVAKGIGLDPRIGPHFLRAGLGYGGSCFPKDVRALDFCGMNSGYDFRLLKSTIEVNTKQLMLGCHRLRHLLGGLSGKEVAILGLTFKPHTNDIREAPAVSLINLLHNESCRIRVYDPAVIDIARPLLPLDTTLATDIYSATAGAHAICLVTEWPEFIGADWMAIKMGMQPPYVVLDGRNALNQEELSSLGFNYAGIGRKTRSSVESRL
ncbi:MAG: UDP-glucose/GDP-mannose dehydrogenase family protein [Dehalococcoidia bacterium]|jgi:UDPglucose 6-dehydrogenase